MVFKTSGFIAPDFAALGMEVENRLFLPRRGFILQSPSQKASSSSKALDIALELAEPLQLQLLGLLAVLLMTGLGI